MNTNYAPKPLTVEQVSMPDDLMELIELLAEHAHDVWACQRIKDGWRYGPRRDDVEREHPCLTSYSELPETEKEYDRRIVVQTIKAIMVLGYAVSKRAP
jgi:hypothetical protein